MDEITRLTMRVIALEETLKKIPDYKTDIGNIYFRLKVLDDLKIAQELQILRADLQSLKKEVSQKAELVKKIKKINR